MLTVWRLLFLFPAASDTTITGWAEAVHAVYTGIAGYLLSLFVCLHLFCTRFLCLLFLLDRLRKDLREMDYFKLLRVMLEHQSLVSFVVRLVIIIFFFFVVFCYAYFHYCRAIIWGRRFCEVLDRNEAISLLKKEVELLSAEKERLLAEAKDLPFARSESEGLRKEVVWLRQEADLLRKQAEEAKAA